VWSGIFAGVHVAVMVTLFYAIENCSMYPLYWWLAALEPVVVVLGVAAVYVLVAEDMVVWERWGGAVVLAMDGRAAALLALDAVAAVLAAWSVYYELVPAMLRLPRRFISVEVIVAFTAAAVVVYCAASLLVLWAKGVDTFRLLK